MANKHNGDYYLIELTRGDWTRREYFEIGVNRNGEIISTVYDGQRIMQYNGCNAEQFAEQMITQSDPIWSRLEDRFPGGRS